MRWLLSGLLGIFCLSGATFARTPDDSPLALANPASKSVAPTTACISEISFIGLRHISSAAVATQLSSRVGAPLDARRIETDVRTLARLGWFETIQVETRNSATLPFSVCGVQKDTSITFQLKEFPFLSIANFSGSRLLSQKQIEKLLDQKHLSPRPGKPADPATFQRIAFVIQSALSELGYPEASVRIDREEALNATVAVRFRIDDGPLLRVRQVNFEGHPQFPAKLLRRQMHNITPWQPFASLRSKDAYTREAFEEDRQRILSYYQNRGYPEARIGNPQVMRISKPSGRWLPWLHIGTPVALSLSVPVEAGPFYRLESVVISQDLQQSVNERRAKQVVLPDLHPDDPYSAEQLEKLRRFWLAQLQPRVSKRDSLPYRSVVVRQALDPDKHAARIALDLGDSPPYVVQRIEFLGLHKFSDRYLRSRIPLREGQPVDERALEAGLARLTRTGYFKPIRREDVRVQMEDQTHTAKISIRVEEIGQQRASLIGGNGQFGNTLGIAYTVFGLLNREELLSTQLEGGPEYLDVMLGLAKEGIFGTRASLAFSVFNNVIRPRFLKSAQGPFFTSHSEGINIPWTYALTNTDSLGLNYTLSRATTEYQVAVPQLPTDISATNIQTKVSSRSFGTGWQRQAGSEHVVVSDSISGGLLGGGENMIRSSTEYGRILHDPIFSQSHAWAFRTKLSAAGSYRGDMPFYSRFFSGDEIVRGLRPGDLGPYALTAKNAIYSRAPAGANLVASANAEYRISLGGGMEAASFFDIGSGWLLPNWLGPAKPLLLPSTNGVLHGSTGIEFRWTVPGVQVPLRAYYAVNVLRLNRSIRLSDRSIFFARNRFSAFGWGLGALF